MAGLCGTVASKTRVVLLSCGSFNPITFLHLRMLGKNCLFTCIFVTIFHLQLFPVKICWYLHFLSMSFELYFGFEMFVDQN